MSAREIIMSAAGLGTPSYWLGTVNTNTWLYAAYMDASGNLYVSGTDYSTTFYSALAVKISSSGLITWQRSLTSSSLYSDGFAITCDTSGNVYLVNSLNNGSTTAYIQSVQYNPTGTIQWQRSLDNCALNSKAGGSAISGSGITVCGQSKDDTTAIYIADYNGSGSLQWQRYLGDGSGSAVTAALGVTLDTSANAYVGGISYTGTNQSIVAIAKYNSSGTIQWQRTLTPAVSSDGFEMVRGCVSGGAIGVVNFAARFYLTGGVSGLVGQYSSSGTLNWQRVVSGLQPTSMCTSPNGDVYVLGFQASASTTTILIFKYNSSGTLQWQRELSDTSGSPASLYAEGACADNDTLFLVGAYSGASYGGFMASLPTNGSLTGTYSISGLSISYSTPSYTESAGTGTSASSSLSDNAGTATSSTSTDTDAAASLTLTKVSI